MSIYLASNKINHTHKSVLIEPYFKTKQKLSLIFFIVTQ